MDYIYRGDRFTQEKYRYKECSAIRTDRGKCIRGRNGNMLVRFYNGDIVVVMGRRLIGKEKYERRNYEKI